MVPRALPPVIVERYALYEPIASGGMASVHLGQLLGPAGFARLVAIKRLHEGFGHDPSFVAAFLDEARLAARVRHPNVVATLDVIASQGELFIVMEYIHGLSLAQLIRGMLDRGQRIPSPVAASIVSGALQGLHAAHEATNQHGANLGIVHRDVSPQNILIGADGTARVLDFGIAKAIGMGQTTRDGHLKGKIAYMSPEQVRGGRLTRQSDIYAAAVVLWETLVCKRLFKAETEAATLAQVLSGQVCRPSEKDPALAPFDDVVMRGLAGRPEDRFATAREMALAVERCVGTLSPAEVADWLEQALGEDLSKRADLVAAVESDSADPRRQDAPPGLAALATVGDSSPPAVPSDDRDATDSSSLSSSFAASSPAGVPSRRATTLAVAAALTTIVGVTASLAWGLYTGRSRPASGTASEPGASASVDRPAASASASSPAASTTPSAARVEEDAAGRATGPTPSSAPASPRRSRPAGRARATPKNGPFDAIGGRD